MIVKLHGSEAEHFRTEHVEEVYRGKRVWRGDVELFALTGNPRAKGCYAWGLPNELGVLEIATVLKIPPVLSAEMAVQLAIASGARLS